MYVECAKLARWCCVCLLRLGIDRSEIERVIANRISDAKDQHRARIFQASSSYPGSRTLLLLHVMPDPSLLVLFQNIHI